MARLSYLQTGPTNSLVDVAGLAVGQAQRVGKGWRSGVTVVRTSPAGAVAGVDVRGGGPGTRETDLLDPRNIVERAHAIVLTGGSAFGLATATGVMARLADDGIGFPVGVNPGEVVPIVPAAVLFDLGRGGDFRATPDAALGAEAYDAASTQKVATGSVGAGTGALAGGLAGGVGSASVVLASGHTVAALAIVNAAGSPVAPDSGELFGVRYGISGEFAVRSPEPSEVEAWAGPQIPDAFNTTIGVVATDAPLTKAQCAKLAGIAHDGMARALRPVHTMLDGDTVFALATGQGTGLDPATFHQVLIHGADCFSRAIVHGVLDVSGRDGAPSYLDTFPSARVG